MLKLFTHKYLIGLLTFFTVLATAGVIGGGHAEAATITVGSSCTLTQAIQSVNGGAPQGLCGGSGYGINDTINIPAGTITLSADLPPITEPVTVKGAGMNSTIINGNNGQYDGLFADSVDVTFSDIKAVGYKGAGFFAKDSNITLKNLEVDGQGADEMASLNNTMFGIYIYYTAGNTYSVNAEDIYIHNIEATGPTFVFLIEQSGGGTTNSVVNKLTIANIQSTESINGFTSGIGLLQNFGSVGTVNTAVSNATVHNIVADSVATSFGSFAFAAGGAANITTDVSNVTITGMRGATGTQIPVVGIKSAAFYSSGAGLSSGSVSTTVVNVRNSLFADNLNDGTSSNCTTADLTPAFSGAGTAAGTITSDDYNMSDDDTCASFTEQHDRQNASNIISTLGELKNNGGAVPTRALLAGSPAISAGGAVLGVSTDARGVARPATNPSVGAYQYVLAETTTTPAAGGTLAETGIAVSVTLLLGLILGSLAYVYYDYRRHKKPLQAQDPSVRYTLLHHVKVVTLPLLRYRVSFSVSRVGSDDGVHRF